jgi:hypothetical protein
MSATTDAELATVAANLYGALIEARPYVKRRLDIVKVHGSDRLYSVVASHLDRIDAALAEAGEYLESDGK